MNATTALITATICFVAYSVIMTTTGGAWGAAAAPLLVLAVGTLIWNAVKEERQSESV